MSLDEKRPVVYTNQARCRDCYRCVRQCPVKAIRLQDGQASVDPERCIVCGTCVRECPQGAKTYRRDLPLARTLLQSGRPVAASLAPSFAGVFPAWQARRLPAALRKLGFAAVEETAVGAALTAAASAQVIKTRPDQPWILSACPAVVNYVEQYLPEQAGQLVPVVSPMLAHARDLKSRRGANWAVIFIGPCVAKKAEAERAENADQVECVLTFQELAEWLAEEKIELAACEESGFDHAVTGAARLFPLEGGCARTLGWSTDSLAGQVAVAGGFSEVEPGLEEVNAAGRGVIEPLFCAGGCLNGPAARLPQTSPAQRREVLAYAGEVPVVPPAGSAADLSAEYSARPVDKGEPDEAEILRILTLTGKDAAENRLNCGACGYAGCREQAIAVLRGLAEPEMCIPHMRRLAERRADRIIEASPNGIVILDERLRIVHMNPAFRKMFVCGEALIGLPVAELLDPEPFERLAAENLGSLTLTAEHARYNLLCRQMIYRLPEERQYVGIFVNLTGGEEQRRQLSQLRAATVSQARELLAEQVRLAETVAGALGECTARSEGLLEKLLALGAEEKTDREGGAWRNTYTSK